MTSSTASRQGVAAEGIFIGLLVRNTFIDDVFWDVEPPTPAGRKRHSSAPPRTAVHSLRCAFPKAKPDACHSEDESTQGGIDTSSDGQSSEAGFHDDAESVVNDCGSDGTSSEQLAPVNPRWSDVDDTCAECSPIEPATRPTAEEHSRTSLKSSAKAWAPPAAMDTAVQFDAVVCAAKATLAHAGFGAAIHVTRNAEVTTITGYVGQGQKDAFLGVAQNALVMASQTAANIYLLGYRANPFATDAMGFSVTFGEMGDPQMACWDLYQHGWCSHGWRCRWRHPSWTRQISVKVV